MLFFFLPNCSVVYWLSVCWAIVLFVLLQALCFLILKLSLRSFTKTCQRTTSFIKISNTTLSLIRSFPMQGTKLHAARVSRTMLKPACVLKWKKHWFVFLSLFYCFFASSLLCWAWLKPVSVVLFLSDHRFIILSFRMPGFSTSFNPLCLCKLVVSGQSFSDQFLRMQSTPNYVTMTWGAYCAGMFTPNSTGWGGKKCVGSDKWVPPVSSPIK